MKISYLRWPEAQNYAEEWNALAPTIFTTYDWQASWYEAYGGQEPTVVICMDTTGLLGLAAFQRQGRRIRILGDGTYDSDNLDFVYRDSSIVPELLRAAKDLLGPLDVLDLCTIQPSSPLLSVAMDGWLTYQYQTPHPVVALEPSWKGYLGTLSANMRSSLARKLKKTEGRRRVMACETDEQLPEFLKELFTLHGERWRKRSQSGAFSLNGRDTLFELVARRFLRRGWLRFHLLDLDGEVAAAEFGFTFRGVHSFLQSGFDPKFGSDSPGIVLKATVLKMLIEDGVRYYDFLGGDEKYKYQWGARDVGFQNITAARLGSPASVWLAAKKLVKRLVAP